MSAKSSSACSKTPEARNGRVSLAYMRRQRHGELSGLKRGALQLAAACRLGEEPGARDVR